MLSIRCLENRREGFAGACFIMACVLTAGVARGAEPSRKEAMMPARDGVELATTIHLPPGEGPWPCVLSRTPYNKDGLKDHADAFVARGYAFAAQDCRGKYKSKGKYDPFKTDAEDGYDAVEWIARQPWSNGKLGMIGGSALGITAQLAATQAPPHLLCAYVMVAEASARHNTAYMGGVYRKELNDGWLLAQGALFVTGEQVRHPSGDPHWNWREIPDFHSRIQIPIFHAGGWFDIFAQGTIDNFVGLQARGAGLARGNQKLVMGPYCHGAMGGRLKFPGDKAKEFLSGETVHRWFDRWLKGTQNGVDREPAVRYYLLGDPETPGAPGNEWREADSWPPKARETAFYLAEGGKLLQAPPEARESKTTYAYDPAHPVPTTGGANLILGGRGPMDQRAIAGRQDYLRFSTEPLDAPLEVIGRVGAELFVDSDAPDTDFAVKLVDVYPDGYEALLLDGILRARYREGFDREVFLEPGKVVQVKVDLWSTAVVFHRGHRIAVHVTSSNDPRFDPNPNTGKPLRSSPERRVASNTVHHDAARPSRIVLPVTSIRGRRARPRRPGRRRS